ncbi:MAG TPA: hypothetical protein VGG50_09960, partial [Streptosporangiaceae bacterium]
MKAPTLKRRPGHGPAPGATGPSAASITADKTAAKTATKAATNNADRIVGIAARWIFEGRRLDMQGLADELGVSRVTLFRR